MESSFHDESFLSSLTRDPELMDETILNRSDCPSDPSTPMSIIAPAFSPVCSSPSALQEEDREDLLTIDHDMQHKDLTTLEETNHGGTKLVVDNIDSNIRPRFMTLENKTQSVHYVQMYAVLDRIDTTQLSDVPPTRSQLSIAEVIKTILPSPEDNQNMAKYFSILIGRVLVTHMPYFKMTFSDVVEWHIPHQFTKEMSKPSTIVSNFTNTFCTMSILQWKTASTTPTLVSSYTLASCIVSKAEVLVYSGEKHSPVFCLWHHSMYKSAVLWFVRCIYGHCTQSVV